MKAIDSAFVSLVNAFGALFIFRWSRTVEKPPHFGPECKSLALNGPLEARITSQWLEKTRTVSRHALLSKEKLPAVSSNRQYLWRYKQQQWRQEAATFGYFFRTGTLSSWLNKRVQLRIAILRTFSTGMWKLMCEDAKNYKHVHHRIWKLDLVKNSVVCQ